MSETTAHVVTVSEPKSGMWFTATATCSCTWKRKASGDTAEQAVKRAKMFGDVHRERFGGVVMAADTPAGAAAPLRRRGPRMWMFCVAAVLIVVVVYAVTTSAENEKWCEETEEFFRENPLNSNDQLDRSYAMQCD